VGGIPRVSPGAKFMAPLRGVARVGCLAEREGAGREARATAGYHPGEQRPLAGDPG
jgi:hypothetical protein